MGVSFLTWKRDLDDLRHLARTMTDEDPTPTAEARVIVEEALRLPIDESMPKLRAAARSGVDSGLKPAPTRTVYGWRLCLSRTRFPDGRYSWHLSASLHPRWRATTDRDWQRLGKIAAHLGAPRDPFFVPEDPRDVHHWKWFETMD